LSVARFLLFAFSVWFTS